MTRRRGWGLSLALGLSATVLLMGGGPRDTDRNGNPRKWDPPDSVPFTIDQGPLRSGFIFFSNEDGSAVIRGAATDWNDVATATIMMTDNGFLPLDIDASNFREFFGMSPHGPSKVREENPMIFDADGGITNSLFGAGSSNTILGFAGIRFFSDTRYVSGWAVMNGTRVSSTSLNTTFRQTVLHELGHFLGLDHSQGRIENFSQITTWGAHVPVMFPVGGDSRLPREPIADDVAWLSWLYPEPDFHPSTGTIKGRVFRRSGGAFQGANVVAAAAVANGDGTFTESRENVISVVSDFLEQNTGDFELPGLAPGSYYVFIDPLRDTFTGGSGVGPFDQRPTNFPRDYYSEEESASDDPLQKKLIHVAAGETVTGIEITANEVANRLDLLDDDDEMLYEFPSGFTFPFFGRIYRSVVVNSDGNLTFGVGDAQVGEPRTEQRFLTGPPRIAPLFTDLDPSRLNASVGATEGEGFVRFTWNKVPEFIDGPFVNTNTFSVTLHDSGEILFEYEEVNLTPDQDDAYPQGLHSIVGVTPGAGAQGASQDLSAGPFEMAGLPIYQVFPGSGSFDLVGKQVRFLPRAGRELYFPHLTGDLTNFTGIAVSNFGGEGVQLQVEARNEAGQLAAYPGNPAFAEVESGAQWARLGQELFQTQSVNAWGLMKTVGTEVASFFQIGNGLTGRLTRMDGGTAFTTQARTLYFTRIFNGAGAFPTASGPRTAWTWLAVGNPNSVPVTATMRYFSGQGVHVAEVSRELLPKGRMQGRFDRFFGIETPTADGWVEVSIDGPGAVGFSWIDLGDTLVAFNASMGNPGQYSYSAQLGHGADIFTSLKLVNPTDTPNAVTLTAYLVEPGGIVQPRVFGPVVLEGRHSLQQDVGSLFGFGPGGSEALVGSLEIQSTVAGLIGDVVFGDPRTLKYGAALPLQSQLFQEAVFSQVSNGVDPTNPALSSFTGVALFNPQAQAVNVTIRVFTRDGVLAGETSLRLESRSRISETLAELFAGNEEVAGLVGGYIRVSATLPVVGQQLFGNSSLDYLSAVPPTILE